jgi:hypothetical protein
MFYNIKLKNLSYYINANFNSNILIRCIKLHNEVSNPTNLS